MIEFKKTKKGFEAYVKCVKCHEMVKINVPDERKLKQLMSALRGEIGISDLRAWMSPHDREMFISGFCEKCWNEIFKDTTGEEE